MSSRNDYNAAKLLLIVFKIMGLAPFSISKSPESTLPKKQTGRNIATARFSTSRLGCLYNFLLVVVQIPIVSMAIPLLYLDQYPDKSDLTDNIEVFATVLGNSTVFTIYLTLGVRQKTAVTLLNRLLGYDTTITNRHRNCLLKSSRIFFVIMILTNIVIWTVIVTIDLTIYSSSVVGLFRITIPDLIIAWFLTEYILVLEFIHKRLQAFNSVLFEGYLNLTSNFAHRSFVTSEESTNISLLPKIKTFRRVHANLCEVSAGVSEFYSLPILFSIAHYCIIILYSSYYSIVPYVTMTGNHTAPMMVHSIFSIISTVLPIVLLALGVTSVSAEISKTLRIVDKYLLYSSINFDERIELQQFVLDLSQREIRFTAYGFFSLDFTLVHSILSMVITYLIILLQQVAQKASKNQIYNSTRAGSNDTGHVGKS